ncbi:FecR family protein [Sphingobacterium sp. ML3W]|uniref:FecR family protein n=2 Tax=Sphingobacterium sp. ML3W TaxID=1538644 RepID=UPI00249C8231|nr:FecR domain-containing protein [Sphingobacterium sp. ML3W]WFA82326.1 FecR domain-containing protein [Sphingobacterium sp. ML3W]
MEQTKLINLYRRYLAKQCTDEEIHMLMHYMRQKEYAKLFKELILEDLEYEEEIELDDQARMAIQQLDEYFDREYFYQNRKKNNKKLFAWISIAAAASIICAISVLWYTRVDDESGGIGIADNRSTLITSNGKEIKLDGTSNVELLRENGTVILQDSLGDIHVKVLDSIPNLKPQVIYQTIRTAKGRQSRIYLTDGSAVVLNSDSQLKFPLFYAEGQREVELQGEGFFDVETNKRKPFIVKTHDQRIKVYGTKFNVNNYENEQTTKTTLFHGKVSVQNLIGSSPQKEYILKPGEQIVLDKKSKALKQDKTENEEQVLGWKNGVFVYDNATLKEIMKDFARWYNIDVDLETLPALTFSGTIPRNYELDKALNVIARTANIKINRTGTTLKFEK